MTPERAKAFVIESNRIEGIVRDPMFAELASFMEFMELPHIEVADLEKFVRVCADARLRDRKGMDVRVGHHHPARGGPQIRNALEQLLVTMPMGTAYQVHCAYEVLHPFMDGNGRSGRALWAWQMQRRSDPLLMLGFLHAYYYQSLDNWRREREPRSARAHMDDQ